MIVEIVVVIDGIGVMMMCVKCFVYVDDIMVGIVIIGLLGLVLDVLF